MTAEEQIRNVLIDHGVIAENWKIKITDQETPKASDWTFVYVDCIRPRCRKPITGWKLAINTVRGFCDFGMSKHWNY